MIIFRHVVVTLSCVSRHSCIIPLHGHDGKSILEKGSACHVHGVWSISQLNLSWLLLAFVNAWQRYWLISYIDLEICSLLIFSHGTAGLLMSPYIFFIQWTTFLSFHLSWTFTHHELRRSIIVLEKGSKWIVLRGGLIFPWGWCLLALLGRLYRSWAFPNHSINLIHHLSRTKRIIMRQFLFFFLLLF